MCAPRIYWLITDSLEYIFLNTYLKSMYGPNPGDNRPWKISSFSSFCSKKWHKYAKVVLFFGREWRKRMKNSEQEWKKMSVETGLEWSFFNCAPKLVPFHRDRDSDVPHVKMMDVERRENTSLHIKYIVISSYTRTKLWIHFGFWYYPMGIKIDWKQYLYRVQLIFL